MIKKLGIYLVIIGLSISAAGLFGVVHNQISYTVSPEYFTKFKFEQFGLTDAAIPERVRASTVGFLASWWMGIPIGVLAGLAGFIQPNYRRMLRVSLWSIVTAMVFTLLFGLGGLVYGWLQTRHIDAAAYSDWYIPNNLVNLRRFLCAGYMHNASYLGGTISILVAWIFQGIAKAQAPRTADC